MCHLHQQADLADDLLGAGFEFEGRSKQAVYRDGAFRDVLRYGLLRKRWEGLRHARMPQPVSV